MILVTDKEPLPKDQPTAKTERRVKLNTTPEALFAALTSKDRTRMTEAATALGWEWLAGRIYGDIALHAVNLDADDATERILTLENAAAVLKQEGDDWWLVGSFSCCGPSGRAAEPFVEWKSLVWPDTKDIIVHAGGQTNYQVYRLLRGHRYLVFEIDENTYNWRETIDTKVIPLTPGKLAPTPPPPSGTSPAPIAAQNPRPRPENPSPATVPCPPTEYSQTHGSPGSP